MIKRPLIALSICFILGIVGARWGEPPGELLWWMGVGTLLVTLVALGLRVPGAAGGLLMVMGLVGALRTVQEQARVERDPLRPFWGQQIYLTGTVVQEPRYRYHRWRAVVETDRVHGQGKTFSLASRVYLVLPVPLRVDFGERICVFGTLERPREASNPGQFSYREFLARQGIYAAMFVENASALRRLGRGTVRPPWSWAIAARRALTRSVACHMPPPFPQLKADLLNSIVYGMYAAPVAETIEEVFRRAGVIHVLVASGTQVSLLIGALFLLARGLRWPRGLSIGLGLPLVLGYTWITGAEPSIVRAAIMGLLVLAALLWERDYDLLNALALAALLILLFNPLQLFDPGFQLSFAATLGLVILALPLYRTRWLQHWPPWLALTVSATVSAQLAVVPLLAYHFHRVSLVGFLANVPVVPLAGLLVVSGLLASGLGLVVGPLAYGLNLLNAQGVWLLTQMTAFFAALPHSYVLVPGANLAGVVLYYGVLAALMALNLPTVRAGLTRERLVVGGLVVLTALVSWFAYRAVNATLTVTFLDVGHGDAILIQAPSGRTVLIDAGPWREENGQVYDSGERVVLPALLIRGVRRLDCVVATHPDADHIGGLPTVLRSLPVGFVLEPQLPASTRAYERLRETIEERGLTVRRAQRGQRLNLGRGVCLYVLWPDTPRLQGTKDDDNNNSVVLKLVYGRVSFLLTGDLGTEGEEQLLRKGGNLVSTVLKVAHHGSGSSTSKLFLQAVRPQYAVISGRSGGPDGSPNSEVIQRLHRSGARLYHTSERGALTFRTNGRTVQVRSFR